MEPEKKDESVEDFYAVRLKLGAISQEEYNKLMDQTKVEKHLEEEQKKDESVEDFYAVRLEMAQKSIKKLNAMSHEEYDKLKEQIKEEKDLERSLLFSENFKKATDWLYSLSPEEFEDLANKVAKENMD